MKRYNENDIVIIVKENDKNYGKQAKIVHIAELTHFPVTIYQVQFENGNKKDYFFADIWHA